jgi:hypothetical protein
MSVWNILQPFGIFNGHFGNFVVIWYIFPPFGILCQEKSGNPACRQCSVFFPNRFSAFWRKKPIAL